jgi:hypothetical protein
MLNAHIENIKMVANLSNNKDVFMCILRFHARAGYLHTCETLLKEIQSHPGSDSVEPEAESANQYDLDCIALADRNFNVPSESRIHYPSLMAMMNQRDLSWRKAEIYIYILAYTFINSIGYYIQLLTCAHMNT